MKGDEFKAPLVADRLLLFTTLALVAFSVIIIYSTTGILSQEKFGDTLFFVKRQLLAAALGIALLLIISRVDLEWLKKISPLCLLLSLFLLLLTLIPGVGSVGGGASRWIHLGPLRFQPGELVKVMMVVFMSGFFARHEDDLERIGFGVVKPLMLVGTIAALFLLQPDFGSASIVVMVTLAMMLVSGTRIRYFIAAGVGIAFLGGLLILNSPYRLARVLNFLTPWKDASGKGYQLVQSLIAVGSGEINGVGLGAGQQKLFYLPAAHTDFIFSVIAEELGFIGCLAVISAFLIILWRGMALSKRVVADTFSLSLSVGLTLLIVLPAFLNMGVVIGLLPTKGMVLPLVGYGGSALVCSLMTVGLLLAVIRNYQSRVL